ncbi:hypothetical protein [Thiomicrorhabdus aquaedulcis]|uniref:hypothetical protein n=1 Tax=Thiomicrorhabdus aquaedulcis TaxID=2211106 RepID=UPI000FDC8BBD|nr:hypothetical protein [Thiomicrorhabdus aquaedulcis]
MKFLNTQIISLEPKVSSSASIKPNAPKWVRDGFEEMKKFGMSTQEAITRLRQSPFFCDEWVA